MNIVKADTAWNLYKKLNEDHLNQVEGYEWHLLADVHAYNLHIQADRFWLPPVEEVPRQLMAKGRVDRLYKRYIQEDLWNNDMLVLRSSKKLNRLEKRKPGASTIHFYRRETSEAKVPDGGGCLISISLANFNRRPTIFVASRSSSIVTALVGDFYFFQYIVKKAAEEAELPDFQNTDEIAFEMSLISTSQKAELVGNYIMLEHGIDYWLDWVTREPDHKWHQRCQHWFWSRLIDPAIQLRQAMRFGKFLDQVKLTGMHPYDLLSLGLDKKKISQKLIDKMRAIKKEKLLGWWTETPGRLADQYEHLQKTWPDYKGAFNIYDLVRFSDRSGRRSSNKSNKRK